MTILLLPIPPRPSYFGPDGAPPGIRLMLDAYNTLDDGLPWTPTRPRIEPRLGIVHTNAASVEASVHSSINFGRNTRTPDGRNTTKPHYLVAEPFSAKVLRTDLRGIANSTEDWFQEAEGEQDVSFWSYAIETADTGTKADPAISDFLKAGQSVHGPVDVPHAELVARIFAYESIVHNHPLVVPDRWNGTGIVTHTWPYPYPHYTTKRGKTCPGQKKIATFNNEIIHRATLIREAWLGDTMEEDDMKYLDKMDRMHDSRPGGQQLTNVSQTRLRPGEVRKVPLGMTTGAVAVRVTVVNADRTEGFLSITGKPLPKGQVGPPVVNLFGDNQAYGTLAINAPDGHGYLASTFACDVIVDVYGRQ